MPRLRSSLVGKPAAIVSGLSLDRSAATFVPGTGPSALAFLTSSCEPCQAIWAVLADGTRSDVVAVTPDSATEDLASVASLAGRAKVIMSTAAWLDYGVTKAPWVVMIEDGVVVREGPASDIPTEPA